jgi:hypothetical protein
VATPRATMNARKIASGPISFLLILNDSYYSSLPEHVVSIIDQARTIGGSPRYSSSLGTSSNFTLGIGLSKMELAAV